MNIEVGSIVAVGGVFTICTGDRLSLGCGCIVQWRESYVSNSNDDPGVTVS
jgi:hypothetical protein